MQGAPYWETLGARLIVLTFFLWAVVTSLGARNDITAMGQTGGREPVWRLLGITFADKVMVWEWES